MYREEIEKYIDSHMGEMLEDIKTLCRINSEKMPYQEGLPRSGDSPVHGRGLRFRHFKL